MRCGAFPIVAAPLLAVLAAAADPARADRDAAPCAARGFPPGVCAASWDAAGVWALQFKIGTAVGARRAHHRNAVTAWFRGSIAGGVLTVTGEGPAGGPSCPFASGPIAVGQYVYGPHVPRGVFVTGATRGAPTCGGSANGYGQDNGTWTLSDPTLTVGDDVMVSGGGRDDGAELPSAAENCGMPRVPVRSAPEWGSLVFAAGPGGCTLEGWDFRGIAVTFYTNPQVPGSANPIVYRDNLCDFTGNVAGAGAKIFACVFSSGFNDVTVADNSMDLTRWGGGSGQFGIVVHGTTATRSTVAGNWVRNSPSNSIDVTGMTTIAGNFLDKTGCGNGSHPDTVTWYGFDDGGVGPDDAPNFVIAGNLVDVANCGTHVAAAGWIGGAADPDDNARSLTLTSPVSAADLTRYGGERFAGGDLFAVDVTTGRLIGQVSAIRGATVELGPSIAGSRLYRRFAAASGAKGDQILLVMGDVATRGWSTGDTAVEVDSCVTGVPAGVNDDTPFFVVPNDGATTQVVNDWVKAGGCRSPTEVALFSRPPWSTAMKHDRPAGTVLLYTVGAVSAFRPLLIRGEARSGLIEHNIVFGGDPHGWFQKWQTAVGVQRAGAAMRGVEVRDNLWSNRDFCTQTSGAIAFQANNTLVADGAPANRCP